MHILLMAVEAALLAASVSVDCFASGFAYGSQKIRIPFRSVMTITLVGSSLLGLSFLAGTVLQPFLPDWLTTAICFTVLFVLGLTKLLDSITKSIIRKYSNLRKQINFSIFNFKFVLNLYADPEAADTDHSMTLSPAEAVPLAIALSLDCIAVGFGAAFGNINGWAVFLFSIVTDMIFLMLGAHIGHKIAKTLKFNISWLGGVILMVLAVMNLFP